MASRYDHAVIGAGILGLAVARELHRREPGARIVVLEREREIAAHQTSHNSGVIHAGVYYKPGSLKSRLCVQGAQRMYEYCAANGIEARPIGKLIIAASADELPALDELERRAHANGVPGIRRIAQEEIPELEPHATGVAALHSPNTGIVDFALVARAIAAELQESGVELRLNHRIDAVSQTANGLLLRDPHGDALHAGRAIACAGLWSDRLAQAAGAGPDPRIVPFRGGYLRLKPERAQLVKGLIYPVPDPSLPFLGIHFTPTTGGEVLAGPTALLAPGRTAYRLTTLSPRDLAQTAAWPGTWRMARRWWRTGIEEARYAARPSSFAAQAARYVPALTPEDFEPARSGIRAQAVARDGTLLDDFALSRTPRMLHVRNAPSPAATSALALAEHIVDEASR